MMIKMGIDGELYMSVEDRGPYTPRQMRCHRCSLRRYPMRCDWMHSRYNSCRDDLRIPIIWKRVNSYEE